MGHIENRIITIKAIDIAINEGRFSIDDDSGNFELRVKKIKEIIKKCLEN